jgi:hypothetical protein
VRGRRQVAIAVAIALAGAAALVVWRLSSSTSQGPKVPQAVSLTLTSRQWATVDATMDNAGQTARDVGKDPEPAARIRQAGWEQVPWVGRAREWPPADQLIVITLGRAQWDMIVAQLIADDPVYGRLGDEDSVALGRDARSAITRQLR